MNTFKEMMAADRGIFLNLDEFGDEHVIEGQTITAVLDEETFAESKKGEDIGLAAFDFVLFARVEELPEQRASGESLNVNGKECTIVAWRTDGGMASIYLSHQMAG